ncbi:hypothetical protein NKJ73_14790 [Mesorhizobium sp. M0074]|uniref:hypothetical protein n=1 Tax=unclassified Mesorhizobium TaxID=325217 RepID=UPI00333C7BBE
MKDFLVIIAFSLGAIGIHMSIGMLQSASRTVSFVLNVTLGNPYTQIPSLGVGQHHRGVSEFFNLGLLVKGTSSWFQQLREAAIVAKDCAAVRIARACFPVGVVVPPIWRESVAVYAASGGLRRAAPRQSTTRGCRAGPGEADTDAGTLI